MSRKFAFIRSYNNISEVLTDHELASLGDSYINFAYSLTLSNKAGRPQGTKVKGRFLAEALRKAGLREHMPSRMTSHALADAAEALIVYAWLQNRITLEETVATMFRQKDAIEGLSRLLVTVKNRITFP